MSPETQKKTLFLAAADALRLKKLLEDALDTVDDLKEEIKRGSYPE